MLKLCEHDEWQRMANGADGLVHIRGCELCGALTYSRVGDAPPLPTSFVRAERAPVNREPDGTVIDLEQTPYATGGIVDKGALVEVGENGIIDINHDRTPHG
jgi:hypothetical protein